MSEFQFALRQRVRIKTADIGLIEGVVSGCKAMLNQENEYDVHYLQPDLSLAHIVIVESVLADAQPKKGTITVGIDIDQKPLDEALGKARELGAIVKRVSRPKPARSRKRR